MIKVVALMACAACLTGAAQDSLPTFSSKSELVVLHVAVRDGRGGYVSGLDRDAFQVSENRRIQQIAFFNSQDAPVTVGLLIDSSGSMGPNRELLIASGTAFAKAMNERDEFFVLGFNEEVHTPLPPDRPFTHHAPTLRVALAQAIKARGRTAIYDAITTGLRYVQRGAFERQVLIVVSDGGDNASSATRDQAVTLAQASNAVIYTIVLVDPVDRDADPGFLRQLAQTTGGLAFTPRNAQQIDEILQRVARDIRNMYTIGYVPADGPTAGRGAQLRRVSVEARLPNGRKADVRTRRAYLGE